MIDFNKTTTIQWITENGICQKSLFALWLHNLKPPLFCLLIYQTIWADFYFIGVAAFTLTVLLNCLLHGESFGFMRCCFSTKQIWQMVWRHCLLELSCVNLLWTLLILKNPDFYLEILAVSLLLAAAFIEAHISNPRSKQIAELTLAEMKSRENPY